MTARQLRTGRTRHAVLGVLSYGPSTGYEIRKLLSETTSHFWKESYGQIYPTLEELRSEGLIEVVSHETGGRETRRFALRPEGEEALRSWIRSPEYQLKPGRNELLLKLFFARAADAAALVPQVENYQRVAQEMLSTYEVFRTEDGTAELPQDSQQLIATTIDFGVAAAEMQAAWCERTIGVLRTIGDVTEGADRAP